MKKNDMYGIVVILLGLSLDVYIFRIGLQEAGLIKYASTFKKNKKKFVEYMNFLGVSRFTTRELLKGYNYYELIQVNKRLEKIVNKRKLKK